MCSPRISLTTTGQGKRLSFFLTFFIAFVFDSPRFHLPLSGALVENSFIIHLI